MLILLDIPTQPLENMDMEVTILHTSREDTRATPITTDILDTVSPCPIIFKREHQ